MDTKQTSSKATIESLAIDVNLLKINSEQHGRDISELKSVVIQNSKDIKELKYSVVELRETMVSIIDDLAIMIAKGFKESADYLNEFKKEMYEFKAEMYEFKAEMYEFREEMYQFRKETKDEFAQFRKETKAEFRELHNIHNEHGLKLRNHENRLCKVETELRMA